MSWLAVLIRTIEKIDLVLVEQSRGNFQFMNNLKFSDSSYKLVRFV